MSGYGGHRIPDQYDPQWQNHTQMGEYYEWWHLGYEDGVWQTKHVYGLDEDHTDQLAKLNLENEQLRSLLGANVRVLKEEIRKELKTDEDN